MAIVEVVAVILAVVILCSLSQTVKFYSKLILFYALLFFLSIILIPVCAVRPKRPRNLLYGTWMVDNIISPCFSFQWELQNSERIIQNQSAVIVCNHQSALDVIGMMHVWPHFHPCLPVLKHELLWSGPFGIFCWLAGCVFLNRSNSAEARQLLNEKMNEMKERKIKWWIFPEGTRNDQGFILPFKKGAFHIAVQSQIPIIPVVYSPYSEFYYPKEKKFNTGKTIINVLPPVSTSGLTTHDIPALSEQIHSIMVEEFSKYVNIKN